MTFILERPVPTDVFLPVHPVLSRIYAARGVTTRAELDLVLARLLPWQGLKGIEQAVDVLVPVVRDGKRLLVVGDFDVDGATSTALAVRALRLLGASQVDYLVPNRFEYGYGLSLELTKFALTKQPDVIMTVDNGIASHEGITYAKGQGVPVLVTDHHLPASTLPDAAAIVNPNQPGCTFSSKAACGCTVVFYVLIALKARLQALGLLPNPAPNLAQYLDFVALATVADVVPLDANNRILVEQGLRRIRQDATHAGIRALLTVAGRTQAKLVAADLGFSLGPRLNAAGRLDDMSLGIECLLTDDPARAQELAQELDELNRQRRDIEQGMQHEALQFLKQFKQDRHMPAGLVLYQEDWHQGVIGILASRVKDKTHRPVVAIAKADDGLLKGSARSVAGLHLRDALDEVHKEAPYLLTRFGGHAMAAGLTLKAEHLQEFRERFAQVCARHLSEAQLKHRLETDGQLKIQDFNLDLAHELKSAGPWGQAFPDPLFHGEFEVLSQRLVGERHLKMQLKPLGTQKVLDAIWFSVDLTLWPMHQVQTLHLVYQLDVNEYRGEENLQLLVRGISLPEQFQALLS
ncbi:MAG: hypothetical protein RL217_58 [Pseudomonadota bacterium]|jgi:single-stranded-DNA-specific exonuclease